MRQNQALRPGSLTDAPAHGIRADPLGRVQLFECLRLQERSVPAGSLQMEGGVFRKIEHRAVNRPTWSNGGGIIGRWSRSNGHGAAFGPGVSPWLVDPARGGGGTEAG